MRRPEEVCVLIPTSSLEEIPTAVSDAEARSLLAAWTVLWHPRLIADTGQIPVWYRADSPPADPGPRRITVPSLSLAKLPGGYEQRCRDSEETIWVTGGNRAEMLDRLGLSGHESVGVAADQRGAGDEGETGDQGETGGGGGDVVEVADFFALGYAMFQVQVMTRRLRYTSNLDELRLQERVVSAARAWADGDASAAAEALHDAFDLLAEERDHYFTSDPSLIDLTLLSPSTVRRWAESLPAGDAGGPGASRLATPTNVLVDAETAAAIAALPETLRDRVRRAFTADAFGWAGGGPAGDVCLDSQTLAGASRSIRDAWRATEESLGSAPVVYARFAGSTPPDLTSTLVRLGARGMIPIDFAGGRGFGDEAKVIRQGGSDELEALTVKPTDASSDAAFLTVSSRLGEAIDGGEIATGLFAHWPGEGCDSFHDLRRAASWGLCLGRFWSLPAYFSEGERPYHHDNAATLGSDSPERLERRVAGGVDQPLTSTAGAFRRQVIHEQRDLLLGMGDLARGSAADDGFSRADAPGETGGSAGPAADRCGSEPDLRGEKAAAAHAFAAAIGCGPVGKPGEPGDAETTESLLVNAGSSGERRDVTLFGPEPGAKGCVYAADAEGRRSHLTVDIPALGFTRVATGPVAASRPWYRRLWSGPQPIAAADALSNEFMEVVIDRGSGAIRAVHSGSVRGNRFSLRLVRGDDRPGAGDGVRMEAQRVRTTESSTRRGAIRVSGQLRSAAEQPLAEFELDYVLRRGSRLLEVSGRLRPLADLGENPWMRGIAARVAVASDATNFRGLVRDKLHRCSARKWVAPLGVLIEEAERETLVASAGFAYHRRVGDRFLDTLLAVRGEQEVAFAFAYGFDVRNPVAVARGWIAPPDIVPLASPESVEVARGSGGGASVGGDRHAGDPRFPGDDGLPAVQGWIVHASPAGLLVPSLRVRRRRDGKLAAVVRVVQTRNQGGKVSLRFCRDIEFAVRWDGQPETWEADADSAGQPMESSGDRIKWSLGGHGVIELLVVFANP